ncbi:MAG TPA: DUF3363 domain-containing protein [Sphingomicrobium sp.]|nr:DUF3363 domain-containing protein [Sphingomicrobium sp.]
MDDDFDPWLGGLRSRQSHAEKKYLHAVASVACRGRPRSNSTDHSGFRFKGIGLGRGRAAVAAFSLEGRDFTFCCRRAHVGMKVVRLRGNAFRNALAHLHYIARDGVTRTGERGIVYGASEDRTNGRSFLERCAGDRHYFRITSCCEDGAEYEDLKPLTRRFMSRVEDDLETRLEWIAVDHADTLYPHTHIVLRGKDDRGEDLVIVPDYMNHGMRNRLMGIVSLDLGPPVGADVSRQLRLEIDAEKVTPLDRKLISLADGDGTLKVVTKEMAEYSALTGRLHKLRTLGLAELLPGSRWQLKNGVEDSLRAMRERREVATFMQRKLCVEGLQRSPAEQVIHAPGSEIDLTGRLLVCGSDETSGRAYLLVDATDGRSHYLEIGKSLPLGLPKDAIINVRELRDRPGRSLGTRVKLLSPLRLDLLGSYDGATWLDHELVSPSMVPRDVGFGREVRHALAQRRTWLVEQGLATKVGEQVAYQRDMLSILERRSIVRTAATLKIETGLCFVPMHEGDEIDGIVRRRIDFASSPYAMIANEHAFALVPWDSALENRLGKAVRASFTSSGISWTIERGRQIAIP